MTRNGILVDYQYCTGCYSCEVACQSELELPLGQWGVRVKLPSCVFHCQAKCMKYGPVGELVKDLEEKPQQYLWVPPCA